MTEHEIWLEAIDPLDIYGPNNSLLDVYRNSFPKLKIIARGDMIKLYGDTEEIKNFEHKFDLILSHFSQFGKINENDILQLFEPDGAYISKIKLDKNIITFGNNGKQIKARTINQVKMVDSFIGNDLIFAVGPAGTGKTYTAVALAVTALRNKEVKRIILTRPAVEAGENLGFLPGDLKDKLDPYLRPLYDALRDMIPPKKLAEYIDDGTIEIAPLAFMRGRTLNHACAILDEAQNATENQLKMFLTRMGETSKFIVTGDITQIDLPRNQQSGLESAIKKLQKIKGIDIIMLNEKDVVRHQLVTNIIKAFEKKQ